MSKYVFGLIGLALLSGGSLLGQDPACIGQGGGCAAPGCNSCCDCCPHCGCRLEPVCHICWTTKKVVEYKYRCVCQDICIPGVTPLCKKCDGCDGCCDSGNNGCQESCGGKCCVRETHKLVKYPVIKEVPVRKCTVEWVCPHCGQCNQCDSTSAPTVAPIAPNPAPPAPLPRALPSAPKAAP